MRAASQALWEMSSQHSGSRLPRSLPVPQAAVPGLQQHSSAEGSRPWVSLLECGAGGSGCCSVITLSQCCSSRYRAEITFWSLEEEREGKAMLAYRQVIFLISFLPDEKVLPSHLPQQRRHRAAL